VSPSLNPYNVGYLPTINCLDDLNIALKQILFINNGSAELKLSNIKNKP